MSTSETINKVMEECKRKHMSCEILGSEAFVRTGVAEWHFDLCSTNNIKLFHNNYLYSSRSGKFGNSYHVQKRKFNSATQILEYIYQHDRNFYSNKKYKPSSIELAYARIS